MRLTIEYVFNYNTVEQIFNRGACMKKFRLECDCKVLHKDSVEKVSSQMADDVKMQDIADFFSVFGDTTRVKILWALDKGELCVCDIAAILGMTKSAISHQLKVLKDNRLVTSRKSGKEVFYSLHDSHVKEIFEKAAEHIDE